MRLKKQLFAVVVGIPVILNLHHVTTVHTYSSMFTFASWRRESRLRLTLHRSPPYGTNFCLSCSAWMGEFGDAQRRCFDREGNDVSNLGHLCWVYHGKNHIESSLKKQEWRCAMDGIFQAWSKSQFAQLKASPYKVVPPTCLLFMAQWSVGL